MGVVLSGVPSSVLALVLGDQEQGAAGYLYLGFLDSSGNVIADPYLWWKGKYSHSQIDESGTECTVHVNYDAELIDIDRSKEGRWTHDAQQFLFPGDLGFQYVVAAADWHGQWGGQKVKVTATNKRVSSKPKGGAKRSG